MADKKYRSFVLLLYPNTDSYDINTILDNCKDYFDSYAYILHDKDITVDGEIKKSHIHFIGKCETPRTLDGVINKVCVPSNFIKPCSSFRKSCQYLVHLNDSSKYQYPSSDVITNIDSFTSKYLTFDEGLIVKALIDMSIEGASMYQVMNYSISISAYDIFRRNYSIINSISNSRKFYKKEI